MNLKLQGAIQIYKWLININSDTTAPLLILFFPPQNIVSIFITVDEKRTNLR